MEPKTKQFHHKKYELQFDTSTSIILASRLFKARGYNLRFISEPLYRFLYGIPLVLFIVQLQYVEEYYSSSTGITHLRGLTRHTSTDAAYTDRRSGRVQLILARPLTRNPHYGVGEGRCGGCEASIVRRKSCGRTTSSRWAARYILLIYHCGLLL